MSSLRYIKILSNLDRLYHVTLPCKILARSTCRNNLSPCLRSDPISLEVLKTSLLSLSPFEFCLGERRGWYQVTLSPFTLPSLWTNACKLSKNGITSSLVKPRLSLRGS